MLVLLTPSKTMNFTAPAPSFAVPTEPVFAEQAQRIRVAVQQLSFGELQRLMRTSAPLTQKVQELFVQTVRKPSFWVYDGDVFKGVQAKTLTREASQWAQRHVLVPSAVYGVVRPFDEIQPYRLEMQAKLSIDGTKDLFEFWGERVAQYVASYRQKDLLVLSSKEYSRAIVRHLLPDIRVVTPVFLDTKPGGAVAQVPIYNKIMRGVLARWVIDRQINDADEVVAFAAHGYEYDATRSAPNAPVFIRQVMTPLRFE